MNEVCPVCHSESKQYSCIDGYNYFNCDTCDLIYIDPKIIFMTDNGNSIVNYDETYWKNEISSAKARAYNDSVGRLTELMYYAKIPIKTIVDIGTGPGYLLDFVHKNMQHLDDKFYGIEKYPPHVDYQTKSNNYFIGEVKDFYKSIDAGVCIEVIEHLTPLMFKNLLLQLKNKSNKNAIYMFNTGLSSMVKNGNNQYLDPIRRGHIISWSIKAVKHLAHKYKFSVREIEGKNFAFVLEFDVDSKHIKENIIDRVWSPLEENLNLLRSDNLGDLLVTFGRSQVREFLS